MKGYEKTASNLAMDALQKVATVEVSDRGFLRDLTVHDALAQVLFLLRCRHPVYTNFLEIRQVLASWPDPTACALGVVAYLRAEDLIEEVGEGTNSFWFVERRLPLFGIRPIS